MYENELFQLIQYDPATNKVAAEPLLYVPPLVNRYYMIDLTPRQSLVKWLVDEGRTVFVISWVNPGPELKDMHGFARDYAAALHRPVTYVPQPIETWNVQYIEFPFAARIGAHTSEHCTDIATEVRRAVEPHHVRVTVRQHVRGGIVTEATAELPLS